MLEKLNLSEDELNNLKKFSMIILGLIIFAIIVLLFSNNTKNNALTKIKENKRKDLIYTIKQKAIDGRKSEIPHINIKDTKIDNINKEIEEFTADCYKNPADIISYQYDISDKILSLVVKTAHFDKIYYPDFRTYNINLSDLSILTEDDLLKLYNLTTTDVEDKIETRFRYFYNDMLNNDYYSGECDYECFLYFRGDKGYLDDIHYYIKNNKLYIYKAFNIYSIYDEEKYFKEDDFLIEVSD